QIDTGLIEREGAGLVSAPASATPEDLSLMALFLLDERRRAAAPHAASSQDANSPWAQADGWRLNGTAAQEVRFNEGPQEHCVTATSQPAPAGHWYLDVAGQGQKCRLVSLIGREITARIGQAQHQATVVSTADTIFLLGDGRQHRFGRIDRFAATGQVEQTVGALISPMPGRIIRVHVKPGDKVRRGQILLVVEAMKMEHMIVAPADGTVAELHYTTGDQVAEATELLRLEEAQ
ncbi:MAG: acetyl-CoA carboxylase biotin carboxyl carrier protein subunit, partial [Alphaproteobacteria bacterium]